MQRCQTRGLRRSWGVLREGCRWDSHACRDVHWNRGTVVDYHRTVGADAPAATAQSPLKPQPRCAGDGAAAVETARGAPPHLRIVAAQAVGRGKEVHNTYGEYGTTELIYKHGFALRQNPFDAVAVEVAELRESCVSVLRDTSAADGRMAAVAACLREAAGVAEEQEDGTGRQERAAEDTGKTQEAQLELFGPDCVEGLTDSYLVRAHKAKGFMAFPLFAALWWIGLEDRVAEEAKEAGDSMALMAVTAVTAAMRDSGEGAASLFCAGCAAAGLPLFFAISRSQRRDAHVSIRFACRIRKGVDVRA